LTDPSDCPSWPGGWLRHEENIAKQRYGADGVVDQNPTAVPLRTNQISSNKVSSDQIDCGWTTTPALRATPPGQEGQSLGSVKYVITQIVFTTLFKNRWGLSPKLPFSQMTNGKW